MTRHKPPRVSLYDLLIAYCDVRKRQAARTVGKHPALAQPYRQRRTSETRKVLFSENNPRGNR